ncbi:hypothetical protein FJZ39_02135 [Candidatus Saccharibacteria bacterium]|nr:hypothetical protein [Candidatus Saccharibacteria bacterium]
MTKGIYGAFNKTTGECIYVGKSNSSITGRWNHHKKLWKAGRPIHRQPLLTQYLYFFGDQVEWRILSELSELKPADWIYTDNDLLEAAEREIFFQLKPIANAYIPNGWDTLRLVENNGEPYSISEWNPYAVDIRISKGQFARFSDDKPHFTNPHILS